MAYNGNNSRKSPIITHSRYPEIRYLEGKKGAILRYQKLDLKVAEGILSLFLFFLLINISLLLIDKVVELLGKYRVITTLY